MKILVTEKHFNLAVAVPWSTTTCIIAQAIQDATGKTLRSCGSTGALFDDKEQSDLFYVSVIELQSLFDDFHANGRRTKEEILAFLPYTINVYDPTNLSK